MTKNKENMNNPIDEQEVRNLISQIQSGNTDAEVQLVDLYKRYTVSLIRIHKENGYTLTDEEIASARESALKRAARKFDLNKVVPLPYGTDQATTCHSSGCAYRQLRCCKF